MYRFLTSSQHLNTHMQLSNASVLPAKVVQHAFSSMTCCSLTSLLTAKITKHKCLIQEFTAKCSGSIQFSTMIVLDEETTTASFY